MIDLMIEIDYLLFSYTKISLKAGIVLRIVLIFNKKLTNKKIVGMHSIFCIFTK